MPGWRRIDLDFAFIALEAERKPALRLPAIFAPEADTNQFGRQIIVNPVARFRKQAHRFHARLFVEFANGGRQRPFAVIDAALRHLPQLR
ncbi:hypothetical protein D3C72_1840350 [compost metagenome]